MGTTRRAFTRSDLLLALLMGAGLACLATPALVQAQRRSRDQTMTNNLKIVLLAAHSHQDTSNRLPPGFNDQFHSATAHLLPFMEQEVLFKKIDFKKSITDQVNQEARGTVVKAFLNPEDKVGGSSGGGGDPTKSGGPTNMLFNGQVFYHNSKMSLLAITDGTSNTVFLAETLRGDGSNKAETVNRQHIALTEAEARLYAKKLDAMGVQEFKDGKHVVANRGASWIDGRFLQGTFLPGRDLNDARPDVVVGASEDMSGVSGPRSLTNSVRVGLGDGSVRQLRADRLGSATWLHAQTPQGGEVLGADW